MVAETVAIAAIRVSATMIALAACVERPWWLDGRAVASMPLNGDLDIGSSSVFLRVVESTRAQLVAAKQEKVQISSRSQQTISSAAAGLHRGGRQARLGAHRRVSLDEIMMTRQCPTACSPGSSVIRRQNDVLPMSDRIEPFRRVWRLRDVEVVARKSGKRVVMQKRWAFLTVLVALTLGAATTLLLAQGIRASLSLSLSCLLLSEAEKAGYLNRNMRTALIQKIAASPSLSAADRKFVPQLGTGCPKR